MAFKLTDKPRQQKQPESYIDLFDTARCWLVLYGFLTDAESNKVRHRINKQILKEKEQQ